MQIMFISSISHRMRRTMQRGRTASRTQLKIEYFDAGRAAVSFKLYISTTSKEVNRAGFNFKKFSNFAE